MIGTKISKRMEEHHNHIFFQHPDSFGARLIRPRALGRSVGLLQDGLEGEWGKDVAVALVELWLELDPVESEGVQESRESLHQAQDADR